MTPNTKHTPTLSAQYLAGWEVVGPDGIAIALVRTIGTHKEAGDLARLFAASPALVAALRNFVCAADELTDGQINPNAGQAERDFIAAHEAARAALAQAEGGAK